MEPAHYHIIEKVYVDVDTTDIQYANELKNDMGEFLRNKVFPQIELLFDDYNLPESIIRCDKIELDFNFREKIDFEKLKKDIVRQMENKLISQIDSLSSEIIQNAAVEIQSHKIRSISHHQNFESLFLFFLSNGHFPWYGNRSRFENQMSSENWDIHLQSKAFIEKLKKLLSDNGNAANRFVAQFYDAAIFCLLENLHPVFTSYKLSISNFSKKLKPEVRHIFWLMLVHLAISDHSERVEKYLTSVHHLLGEIIRKDSSVHEFSSTERANFFELIQNVLPGEIFENQKIVLPPFFQVNQIGKGKLVEFAGKALDQKSEDFKPEHELPFFESGESEIAVQNSGLILLHPFIHRFFVQTGIAGNTGSILDRERDLAVQSLHYLATGQEDFFEAGLVFEKFICGVPLKMPVQRQSLLTEQVKEESEILLKNVISHWGALKNSSPDGLRQTFLQRNGKLMIKDETATLQVERKSYDVLLDKLPWNISMVKLPWLKKIIFVEW